MVVAAVDIVVLDQHVLTEVNVNAIAVEARDVPGQYVFRRGLVLDLQKP